MSATRKYFGTWAYAPLAAFLVFGVACADAKPKTPTPAMTTCELPRSAFRSDEAHAAWNRLMATPEGCKAWHKMTEIYTVFVDNYHRKIEVEEFGDLFVKGLGDIDPHTGLLTPKAFTNLQQSHRGEFGGIGIEVQLSRGDPNLPKGVLIVSPFDGTPGAAAGLKSGDVIVEIEEIVNGHKEMKAASALTLEQAVDMLRGPVNTPVTFKVYRTGAPDYIPFTVVRAVVKMQFVKHELKGDVGYIKINSFGETTTTLLVKAIAALERESLTKNQRPVSGYVLDMSNNPGGLLDQSVYVLNRLLDPRLYANQDAATMLSTETRGERQAIAFARGGRDMLAGKPLLVLVNNGSASASEIVAGVLQDHGRVLVASSSPRTFGKGSIQTIIPTESGTVVKLTTAQYLVGAKGCERPIQGKGVVPDIVLKRAEGEPEATYFEEKLADALKTAVTSPSTCRYRRKVSDEHRMKIYQMLEVMKLQPVTPLAQ